MNEYKALEEIVARVMEIPIENIHRDTIHAKDSTARYFLWYILHTEQKITIEKLQKEYHRKRRAVYYGIAKIRFGLDTQPYYRRIMAKIIELRQKKEVD